MSLFIINYVVEAPNAESGIVGNVFEKKITICNFFKTEEDLFGFIGIFIGARLCIGFHFLYLLHKLSNI